MFRFVALLTVLVASVPAAARDDHIIACEDDLERVELRSIGERFELVVQRMGGDWRRVVGNMDCVFWEDDPLAFWCDRGDDLRARSFLHHRHSVRGRNGGGMVQLLTSRVQIQTFGDEGAVMREFEGTNCGSYPGLIP
jgi:hypothetical protein